MKTAMVTGGAGFIGSHLVDRLLESGYKVRAIDDLSLGKEENLMQHKDNKNFSFYKKSICDDTEELFDDVDVVFHLAALPKVQFSITEPVKTNYVNIYGTLNLLEICKKKNAKRFIFSASSSAYGSQRELPLVETMKPNPISPYGLQKLTSEGYCRLYHLIHRLKTISLRYFNVYGPRQNPHGDYAAVIPKFIDMINQDKQPVINNDGEQTRDFTFIDDVVDANILAANTDEERCFGETINIGGGQGFPIVGLFNWIKELSGKNIEPIYNPGVIEPRYTLASIDKAENLLGWHPRTLFKDGLEKTYKSFKK